MGRFASVPPELRGRPFTTAEADAAGLSQRMLEHPRFQQVFPGAHLLGQQAPTTRQRLEAARLYLPTEAVVSHQTRFLPWGLDVGGSSLHFTTPHDQRVRVSGLVVHRTTRSLTAHDRWLGVDASILGSATTLSLIDLVAVIDWLSHRSHANLMQLKRCVDAEPRRPGIARVRWALEHVEPRSRSVPESHVRVLMVAAGLPRPESNIDVFDDAGNFLLCGDLVYRWLRLTIEYEGRQHELDAEQFRRDIHRYARARAADWDYVQVTRDMLRQPRACVTEIHQAMRRRGYDGPAPRFGPTWARLFEVPGV